jgi:enoyl-CoA hydratase
MLGFRPQRQEHPLTAKLRTSFPLPEVGQILIDAPPHNLMTWDLNEQLRDTLPEVAAQGARIVVIGSAVDGYFIAHGHLGDNVETFTGGNPSGDIRAGIPVFRELDVGPMVSIAAIDGQAWGGGAELAWACDLRVASERATFAQPEVLVGVTPAAGGAAKLARIAGEAAALRLVLDGRPVDAHEAYRLGLIHRLVPAGEALDAATDWARWLVGLPPWALEANKRAVKGVRDTPLRDALRQEGVNYAEAFSRADALQRAREIQGRYDAGADSYEAFGIPRENGT